MKIKAVRLPHQKGIVRRREERKQRGLAMLYGPQTQELNSVSSWYMVPSRSRGQGDSHGMWSHSSNQLENEGFCKTEILRPIMKQVLQAYRTQFTRGEKERYIIDIQWLLLAWILQSSFGPYPQVPLQWFELRLHSYRRALGLRPDEAACESIFPQSMASPTVSRHNKGERWLECEPLMQIYLN